MPQGLCIVHAKRVVSRGLQISLHIDLPGILNLSDLDSLTIFILGGYSEPLGFGLWQFSLGGYSEPLGFGLSDNFHFGGVFWTSWIWTLWQSSLGGYSEPLGFGLSDNFHFGGYSEPLGFGLSDNFHFVGVFWTSWIWTLWQFSFLGGYSEPLGFGLSDNFHFWGGILNLLDLDSLTIFIWGGGGYSEPLRFGLSDNFYFLGGYSETVLQNRGYSPWIWTKISTTPAGSCITDSLSHTTYVETNDVLHKPGEYINKYSICVSWPLFVRSEISH